ncbi:TetR family transcriptional regulator [Novosphingobium sp. PhB165]|uniref:TetR/AcrR family transcriptional regulator n=1 Tax=Novosphingobium sp. PhB165 TaxID=2485105 RepID=UPI0010E11E7C|nr:TetR/AcrR family transcriptional regulator [Novosphingobium sp. PhB165]TCM12731.1 TetR family transcriptional regulator [Novosphingobium sp. PhB165]
MAGISKPQEKSPVMDRAAWVAAALKMLAKNGIDGVRVEVLARKLGVTKGSFYWHFKDRPDLYDAMLEHWRQHVVTQIIDRLNAIDLPQERYHCMMRLPFDRHRPDFDMELAIRLWARRDERAAAALAVADETRIQFIVDVLVAAGAPSASARSRAVLIFSFLRVGAPFADEFTLAQCEELLIAP